MKPIMFEQCNGKYIANGCFDLPSLTIKNEQFDTNEIISCWEIEDDELIDILKKVKDGERPCIYLSCVGGQPPVRIVTDIQRIVNSKS